MFVESYSGPVTPCEGLALDDVLYGFTVGGAPSLDCTVGTVAGPGNTNDIHPPNIEGTAAGVLHLTFDQPTTDVSFGVALSTPVSPQTNSVIVNLYRPGAGLLRQELFLTTTSDPLFVGGRFVYSGPIVKSVTIQFSGPYTRFVLDDLSYFRAPGHVK
ncbi:MAG TPA: hypothetical protein VGH38_38360 [Bryobacteraceae bacterium]